jgi:tripartite-type tricarboxylate transporter receptor subunit TctC
MAHVPYRGSAPALNDLLGGQVDLIFDNITSIIGHARSGNVKALGITTAKRSALAPEFPTVAETVQGYETTSWSGVGVRAGTPKEICDKIEADTRKICTDPVLKERFASLIADPVGSSAAEFAKFVVEERAKWGKLITDIKLKLE